MPQSQKVAENMGIRAEAEEALIGLGYQRSAVKKVLDEMDTKTDKIEEVVREALRKI